MGNFGWSKKRDIAAKSCSNYSVTLASKDICKDMFDIVKEKKIYLFIYKVASLIKIAG